MKFFGKNGVSNRKPFLNTVGADLCVRPYGALLEEIHRRCRYCRLPDKSAARLTSVFTIKFAVILQADTQVRPYREKEKF